MVTWPFGGIMFVLWHQFGGKSFSSAPFFECEHVDLDRHMTTSCYLSSHVFEMTFVRRLA